MMLEPGFQMRPHGLGHEEVAEDVGPERALELLLGDPGDVLDLVLLGGVVHQNVDAAEGRRRLLDGFPAEDLLADVARDGEAARLPQPRRAGSVSCASSCSSL